jgi:hypothetical protein
MASAVIRSDRLQLNNCRVHKLRIDVDVFAESDRYDVGKIMKLLRCLLKLLRRCCLQPAVLGKRVRDASQVTCKLARCGANECTA